jgi:hypothetical protein
MKDEFLAKLVSHVAERTMNGEIVWSSIDILDIHNEIMDKNSLVLGLKDSEIHARATIKEEIEFLALKGYSEERILKQIARKRTKLFELTRRRAFVEKTQKRLKKRAKTFKTELSRGWYIRVRDLESKRSAWHEKGYTLIIRRHEARTGIPVFFVGFAAGLEESATTLSSDEIPILYTLGILLKKRKRVIKDLQEPYTIDFGSLV